MPIGDASIGSGESVSFQDMACRACDRSSTTYDVRHVMTTNAVYQLPFGKGTKFPNGSGPLSQLVGGWELAGIASARTGLPVNITVSRSAGALLDGNTSGQRPNLVPGVPIYAANQTINNWFNPAAFSAPANGTWGNLGRYIADGPGAYEIDSSLQKRFRLTEKVAINFRAAAFNLLNHPEYKNPGASIGSVTGSGSNLSIKPSASFGRITGMDAVVLLPMAGKQTDMAVKTFFSQRSAGMIDGRQHGTSSPNSKSKREGARAHRSDPLLPPRHFTASQ